VPTEPVIFFKATSCIVGPDDDIMLPKNSVKTDWEVELAVVIGTTARYVAEDRALDHVAGYCIVNDVSEREYQSSAAARGTRERAVILSDRSDLGSSRRTKWATRRVWTCGSM